MFGSRNDLVAELAQARERIAELEAQLERLSASDPISADLLPQRSFRAGLERDIHRAQRYGRPLTVALIDIDRFRYLNLKHGYGVGDIVLGAAGAAIAAATRSHDLATRVGGDEFAILFPETPPAGVLEAVERILDSLAALEAGGVTGHSASAGIAVLEPGQNGEALLAAAAAALERSRAAGGGRVTVYAPGDEEPEPQPTPRTDVVTPLPRPTPPRAPSRS